MTYIFPCPQSSSILTYPVVSVAFILWRSTLRHCIAALILVLWYNLQLHDVISMTLCKMAVTHWSHHSLTLKAFSKVLNTRTYGNLSTYRKNLENFYIKSYQNIRIYLRLFHYLWARKLFDWLQVVLFKENLHYFLSKRSMDEQYTDI